MCVYIYDIASEMFAERSSRKMPQWWWVHRSLFQPTSWPGFKMPWDFPWPPAWWLEGAWAHMYRPGYARIIIYIFYVGIPNKTTNPSVHMYIYIYTPKNTYPDHGFFQTKLTEYIYTYIINHLGMIPLAFAIIPVTSRVTKNESPESQKLLLSPPAQPCPVTFGVELAKWRGNVAVLLWWRFSVIILNQISFGLSWLGATLPESWVIWGR